MILYPFFLLAIDDDYLATHGGVSMCSCIGFCRTEGKDGRAPRERLTEKGFESIRLWSSNACIRYSHDLYIR